MLDTIVSAMAEAKDRYWSSGWYFFIPYFALYLFFWATHLPLALLVGLFWLLHGLNLAGLIMTAVRTYKSRPPTYSGDAIFWGACLLILWIPGAYLEFPGDPWEHLLRITSWKFYSHVHENPLANKFAYFWAWTFFGGLRPTVMRVLADLYSTFWQGLWMYQLYRFGLRLGFSRKWAKFGALAVPAFFGTSVFSFRYYALSSTPLAVIAYLAALAWAFDYFDKKRPRLLFLVAALALMAGNHRQEILLFAISLVALVAVEYRRVFFGGPHARKKITGLAIALALTYVFAYFLQRHADDHISQWGMFRIWDPRFQYFRTLGAAGWLALVVAIFYFNRHPRISGLTLFPVFTLLFPPFAMTFVALTDSGNTYRVLYAFPAGFTLTFALIQIFGNRRYGQLAAGVVVVLLSALPFSPFWGRLPFQIYRVSDVRSLKYLDATADLIYREKYFDRNCSVIADRVSNFYFSAFFGLPPITHKLIDFSWTLALNKRDDLANFIEKRNVCAMLWGYSENFPAVDRSWVARYSQHWFDGAAGIQHAYSGYYHNEAFRYAPALWPRYELSPYYTLLRRVSP